LRRLDLIASPNKIDLNVVNKVPSLRCGFYEVFSNKPKIIVSSYAMINIQEFNFIRLFGCATLANAEVSACRMRSFDDSDVVN